MKIVPEMNKRTKSTKYDEILQKKNNQKFTENVKKQIIPKMNKRTKN